MESALLTASTIFFCAFKSIAVMSLSLAVTPSKSEHIIITTSAVSIASSAWRRICARISSFEAGSMPPVSISVKCLSSQLASA